MPNDHEDAKAGPRATLDRGSVIDDLNALDALFKTAEDLTHTLPDAPEVTELTEMLIRASSLVERLERRY